MLPWPSSPEAPREFWYPPGHGDLYRSMERTGLLDRLLLEGKEVMFISNVDNLGATVDLKLLATFLNEKQDFLMEVTNREPSDIKGGTLISYDGSTTLLE